DIVLTNYELPVATLSSSDADNTICAGESVTFTAGAGGTNYEFFVNGVSQQSGASSTYTTSALQNNEVGTVKVTNGNNCSALSTGITMTVHPVQVVTRVSNDADDRICAGSSITFTATPSGTSTYNFLVDGVSVQSSASRTFTTTTLTDGDVVTVEVTSAAGCVGTSAGVTVNVDDVPSAAVA